MSRRDRARIGADVGGTFTDVILQRGDGSIAFHKTLSTPPAYDRAVLAAVGALIEDEGREGDRLSEVVHGTTVATNAVLERRGGRAALVTTAGFRDVLELRRVRMPHMYDLFWNKPPPLVERHLRFEVDERVCADGTVLRALDEPAVRALAQRLRAADVDSIAVCLLHAHRHPGHEQRVGAILREELPEIGVSLSSEILREQQEYERSAATAVNAYVRPLMARYLADIDAGLSALEVSAPLMIMQSSGGVMTAADAALRPVYALESGPAAGVVAALGLAQGLGFDNVITLDMGGTTAKASLIEDGRIARSREYEVGSSVSAGSRLLRGGGELLRIPSIDIAEVGAGGGSAAWRDPAGALQVGPRSAGADPGPACYGRGGEEPTVTDANVLLGYIPAGPLAGGELSVSPELAAAAVDRIAEPLAISRLEAARSIHELANATMMRALRAVSSEKGRDPREFALIAYGGAGPIHAAALADELGVTTVLVPPLAGLFSAAGLLFARTEFHDVRYCTDDARAADVKALEHLLEEMRVHLAEMIGDRSGLEWQRSADLRYKGQSWDIEVGLADGSIDTTAMEKLIERFETEHERLYGLRLEPGSPVEIRALRLAVLGPTSESSELHLDGDRARRGEQHRRASFPGREESVDAALWSRGAIGASVAGPLLLDEYDTTVVVPPGWSVRRDTSETLVLEREESPAHERRDAGAVHSGDRVTEQIVGNALATVADEMATTIFRTAHSTVVRDVMDFSAALCAPNGDTVAQAVTIPLHLGSIPTAIDALLDHYGDELRAGDVFVMNDPFDGGMHTSDIFVVKPAFFEDELVGLAVAVAHHGDVGGRVPGTTACDNTEIFQEGLRIPWMRLYAEGEPVEDVFKLIRANVRIPRMTLGDISAEVAAVTVGERGLHELAGRHGAARLGELMTGLIDHSERLLRQEIAQWPDGTASMTDYLDSDGIELADVPITAQLEIRGDQVIVDFSESAPMVRGALNSTHSFTAASVYQAIKAAATVAIPNTAGAFRPITVITRPGTIAHVVMPGASSMRGVTGFRIFDAVNGALAQLIPDRVPAAFEGGNTLAIFSGIDGDGERFIFYELVVGTWGGRPTADGNDGLSNPCATGANIPVEVAESEYPMLIERYGLLQDTGGPGRHRGGLAIERAWRPLVDTALEVRSDRQRHRPYGLSGGLAASGSSNHVSADGADPQARPPMFSTRMRAKELFHHRMAGGGGWGEPLAREPGAVARDVLNEKVSVAAARDCYGVVVDGDGKLDGEATERLRASRRS